MRVRFGRQRAAVQRQRSDRPGRLEQPPRVRRPSLPQRLRRLCAAVIEYEARHGDHRDVGAADAGGGRSSCSDAAQRDCRVCPTVSAQICKASTVSTVSTLLPVCLQAALRALRVSASAAPTTRAQLSVHDAGAMTSRLPRARSVESRDVCLQICLHSAAKPGCLTAAIPSHLPL